MSNRPLFPKPEVHYTDSDTVYFEEIDISTVAEKIVDDIRTVKLDTDEKVNNFKERIAEIIRFHKRKPKPERRFSISDKEMEDMRYTVERGFRKSITSMYKKTTLDTAVIRLQDQATTQEMKQDIQRQIVEEGFNRLKDKTEEELMRIDDRTKILTSVAKSMIEGSLTTDMPLDWGRASMVSSSIDCSKRGLSIAEVDTYTRRMIDKTKFRIRENVQVFLTNPAGKKLEEEIESEKFIVKHITDLREKFESDFLNQKKVVDQTVKEVKDKAYKMVPFQYCLEEEGREEEKEKNEE